MNRKLAAILVAWMVLLGVLHGCRVAPKGSSEASPTRDAAPTGPRVAQLDSTLSAVLHDVQPILYSRGAVPDDDQPAHVRAGSAISWSGDRLLIFQDDANIVAVRSPRGAVVPLLLPRGKNGRRLFDDTIGNKAAKMHVESCTRLADGRVVAFGSGSTSERENLVVIAPDDDYRIVRGSDLYEELRSEQAFAGSELNVEGAVATENSLWLFQRGNGAIKGHLKPVNAMGELPLGRFTAWLDGKSGLPGLTRIAQFDLGHLGSSPMGFTDAAALDDGRIAFLACAEASADTVHDGEILGCRFGVIEAKRVRTTDIVNVDVARSTLKLEGLARGNNANSFQVVADMDQPDEPALLATMIVRGL